MKIEHITAPFGPLWDVQRVTELITWGDVHRQLHGMAQSELEILANSSGLMSAKVATALTDPKPLAIEMPVLNAVLAAQYYEVFLALGLPKTLRVYEPCVGASNPVIAAASALGGAKAEYLTINLNRKLCAELKAKIGHLRMPVRIIEENAQSALAHIPPQSMDVACFHHAVNDILQTAVSEPRGMDTTEIDWFPRERQMIEWLAEDAKSGMLEARGKPELRNIITDAVKLVKPGGYLIFDHFNWQKFIGVKWFPWDIFYNFIPMTRQLIADTGLPVTEIRIDGVNPQWWLVLRVI